MQFGIFTNIIKFLSDPIVLFTAITALGAIVAAIAAVRANALTVERKQTFLSARY